jgi:hypothetical protein
MVPLPIAPNLILPILTGLGLEGRDWSSLGAVPFPDRIGDRATLVAAAGADVTDPAHPAGGVGRANQAHQHFRVKGFERSSLILGERPKGVFQNLRPRRSHLLSCPSPGRSQRQRGGTPVRARTALQVAVLGETVDQAHGARRGQAQHSPQEVHRRSLLELVHPGEGRGRRVRPAGDLRHGVPGSVGYRQR